MPMIDERSDDGSSRSGTKKIIVKQNKKKGRGRMERIKHTPQNRVRKLQEDISI